MFFAATRFGLGRRAAAVATRVAASAAASRRALGSGADATPDTTTTGAALQPQTHLKSHRTGTLVRRKMDEPARDNNFGFPQWRLHRSRWRHLRHVWIFPQSATLHRILFPDLCAVGMVSGALTYANTTILASAPLSFPALPFQLTATALGLLLVFRTNQSNGRFYDARLAWGQIIASSRTMLRFTANSFGESHPQEFTRFARLLQALPRTLIFHVTSDGDLSKSKGTSDHDIELSRDELEHELSERMGELLCEADVEDLMRSQHRPMWVLNALSNVVASVGDPTKTPVLHHRIEHELAECEKALGVCERVLLTPIPTSYTRHTSRFLTAWVTLLPFALWPHCGFWGTIPTSLCVGYGMIAIEDIGVTLEDPNDILPLWRYSDAVDKAVLQVEDGLHRGTSFHDKSNID